MLERDFQAKLIKELKKIFPGSLVMKTDANRMQGMPDLLILYNDRWAALEVKKDAKASHRPNQDILVNRMNEMSYAAFIYPENKEEILDALRETLRAER